MGRRSGAPCPRPTVSAQCGRAGAHRVHHDIATAGSTAPCGSCCAQPCAPSASTTRPGSRRSRRAAPTSPRRSSSGVWAAGTTGGKGDVLLGALPRTVAASAARTCCTLHLCPHHSFASLSCNRPLGKARCIDHSVRAEKSVSTGQVERWSVGRSRHPPPCAAASLGGCACCAASACCGSDGALTGAVGAAAGGEGLLGAAAAEPPPCTWAKRVWPVLVACCTASAWLPSTTCAGLTAHVMSCLQRSLWH